MRNIIRIHEAVSSPIADLVTYRALPTQSIDMIDPFLFLNHHGYQVYRPHNQGLPFGPHPHRGFETVTFILKGDLMHQDSSGGASVINAGGVQWMTAGRGLVHAEISSEEFKEKGGELEILQLWVNLKASQKMTEPAYKGLQKDDIPLIHEEKYTIQVVSGTWKGVEGPFHNLNDIHLAVITLRGEATVSFDIPEDHNIFFYTTDGRLRVNDYLVVQRELIEFGNEGTKVKIEAAYDSTILIGHAKPFDEPVVAHGPFVMNTREEIVQAFQDYEEGKF
ncbi:pirin family protein [Robertkochia solimangrovi]|uniref:pirin family protein n=1 Tax=Robertkochia solimangrovi TaxID=2213046 RepID=UPI00117F705C|nr:pirin family protein [Robertkochia solimangrovi]TRZ42924.1 pirin family protein [Robertkochia solimangrovi]